MVNGQVRLVVSGITLVRLPKIDIGLSVHTNQTMHAHVLKKEVEQVLFDHEGQNLWRQILFAIINEIVLLIQIHQAHGILSDPQKSYMGFAIHYCVASQTTCITLTTKNYLIVLAAKV